MWLPVLAFFPPCLRIVVGFEFSCNFDDFSIRLRHLKMICDGVLKTRLS
jgi:hypothetical protein